MEEYHWNNAYLPPQSTSSQPMPEMESAYMDSFDSSPNRDPKPEPIDEWSHLDVEDASQQQYNSLYSMPIARNPMGTPKKKKRPPPVVEEKPEIGLGFVPKEEEEPEPAPKPKPVIKVKKPIRDPQMILHGTTFKWSTMNMNKPDELDWDSIALEEPEEFSAPLLDPKLEVFVPPPVITVRQSLRIGSRRGTTKENPSWAPTQRKKSRLESVEPQLKEPKVEPE